MFRRIKSILFFRQFLFLYNRFKRSVILSTPFPQDIAEVSSYQLNFWGLRVFPPLEQVKSVLRKGRFFYEN